MKKSSLLVLLNCAIITRIVSCTSADVPSTPPGGENRKAEQAVYYVKADGNDLYDGRHEDMPFQTVQQAVLTAIDGVDKNVTIVTIVVIGTLEADSEIQSSYNPDEVFTVSGSSDCTITITGKPNAATDQRAVLSGLDSGKRVIKISGTLKIRFEHIEISGGTGPYMGVGICINNNAQVVIGNGAIVTNNRSKENGGGVAVLGNSMMIMQGGKITANTADFGGGGVYLSNITDISDRNNIVVHNDTHFIMENGKISKNNAKIGGGGVMVSSGTMTMKGGIISGNKAHTGGGIGIGGGGTLDRQGGKVSGNWALKRANIYIHKEREEE
jgi:hypothetical protein